jgi:WD40 repeat protein
MASACPLTKPSGDFYHEHPAPSLRTLCVLLTVAGVYALAVPPCTAQVPKERATLKGHTYPVSSVGYSSDGKTLASGSDDKTIMLWDVQNYRNRDARTGIIDIE